MLRIIASTTRSGDVNFAAVAPAPAFATAARRLGGIVTVFIVIPGPSRRPPDDPGRVPFRLSVWPYHHLDLRRRCAQRLKRSREFLEGDAVGNHWARIDSSRVKEIEDEPPVWPAVAQHILNVDLLEDRRDRRHPVLDHTHPDDDN